ncbi:MAG: DUF2155 domain-containing protein [Paracoccaceae bacterium]|nr:DUF2155 domain-containing protein [Paracoccaceae bacterium]
MKLLAFCAALLAGPAAAQDMADAPGGILRWLDKVTGETADIELARGQSAVSGFLTILLDQCRYPVENPNSNAVAHLTITDSRADKPGFSGWMFAASPALSALDHPRYDVWVLRCVTPAPPTEPKPAE